MFMLHLVLARLYHIVASRSILDVTYVKVAYILYFKSVKKNFALKW